MSGTQAAVMESVDRGFIALESVSIDATLKGLMSEVSVTQVYRNHESVNIEASYSFPLPLDAVLMELTLELNGETLVGQVTARSEAEETYEEAIESGDSAVLLSKIEPGLYNINVGNLMSGEQAVIRFRYAQLLRWQGDTLRYHLPTTIAPRYGNPVIYGMSEHEVPESSLVADYRFSMRLLIEGALADASISCPTHRIGKYLDESAWGLQVELEGVDQPLDRDFVLEIEKPAGYTGRGLVTKEGDDTLALASFCPQLKDPAEPRPRCIKLVIDCSGSMGGDSIHQAREALREIFDQLKPQDWFNVTVFGSGHELWFQEPVQASDGNIARASRKLGRLDADMGGTEIQGALEATFTCGSPRNMPADVLLITDGELWGHEEIEASARRSGHRLFTVGVGSAINEALLRRLAESTGGACELVTPNERMSGRIVRHFRRINQSPVDSACVRWGGTQSRQSPEKLGTIYVGDTVHVFAWLGRYPASSAKLELQLGDLTQSDHVMLDEVEGEEGGTLARLAAHSRLDSMSEDAARSTAVAYQLVTKDTSYILVKRREDDERAESIPVLRKVPQHLAAGWAGAGSVRLENSNTVDALSPVRMKMSYCMDIGSASELPMPDDAFDDDIPFGDVSTEYLQTDLNDAKDGNLLHGVAERLNRAHPASSTTRLQLNSLVDLDRCGVDEWIINQLEELLDFYDEAGIVIAWLRLLLETDEGGKLDRHVVRLIRHRAGKITVDDELESAVAELMSEVAGFRSV